MLRFRGFMAFVAVVAALLLPLAGCGPKTEEPRGKLEFKVFHGQHKALAPASVLIVGESGIVLVDAQWLQSDAAKVADMIEAENKPLKTILITHAHPDHYFGLCTIKERFPDAKILARQPVVDVIRQEFPAKRVHWQELYPEETPTMVPLPEPLTGHSLTLDGHEIRIIDLELIESAYATAFYVPSAKTLIAGDLIFAKTHHYMADINQPDPWIAAVEEVKQAGPIERVIPGHGPVGGPELLDETIQWMRDYKQVAKPGVRVTEIARAMMEKYPNHDGAIMLWLTRGPGFGLSGAKELGVPPDLMGAE